MSGDERDPRTTTIRGEGAPAVRLPYEPPTVTEVDSEAMRVASEIGRLCTLLRTGVEEFTLRHGARPEELLALRNDLLSLTAILFLDDEDVEGDDTKATEKAARTAEVRL